MTSPPTKVLGRRVVAQIIDGIILSVAIFFIARSRSDIVIHGSKWSTHFNAADYSIYWGISLGYFFLLEWIFGTTIGKLITGVRVREKDGQRAGIFRVFVRTVLRLIDQLPTAYILGWIVAMASGENSRARIGDHLGGTRVVRAGAVR